VSASQSDPRRAAENAFWSALEERRDQIRAAGLTFDERSHHHLREAHADGTLLAGLCAGVGRYKTGGGDPHKLEVMAKVIKRGLPTWEDLLIRPGAPWAPYVTAEGRMGAKRCIADAKAYIPFV
jgi:hypothetical protein